jgi:hypothetical protein
MYRHEFASVADGETAFGTFGTVRIADKIYVVDQAADDTLLSALADRDYVIEPHEDNMYVARKAHDVSGEEIFAHMIAGNTNEPVSLIVDIRYSDGHKHSLAEPLIHETILRAASQRSDLEYYNRPSDHFDPSIKSRMSAFVRHLVSVEPNSWDNFLKDAEPLHAKDFIKAMAAWASKNSDNAPRDVRVNLTGDSIRVSADDVFPVPLRLSESLTRKLGL